MWCFLARDPTQQSGAHTTNQPSSWTPQWQQRKLHKKHTSWTNRKHKSKRPS